MIAIKIAIESFERLWCVFVERWLLAGTNRYHHIGAEAERYKKNSERGHTQLGMQFLHCNDSRQSSHNGDEEHESHTAAEHGGYVFDNTRIDNAKPSGHERKSEAERFHVDIFTLAVAEIDEEENKKQCEQREQVNADTQAHQIGDQKQ